MGPTPRHYDFARTGQADASWFLHGGTPGRFPLTEIINLPFMAGSAEIGTKVLNDRRAARQVPRRRAQGRQAADAVHAPAGRAAHHQEADPHARRLQGPAAALRLADGARPRAGARRDAGRRAADRDRRAALQKGTIDGAFIDYGGAGIAFKLGGTVKYSTELYAYVTSFGLALNEDFWDKLPPDLKKLVIDTTTGKEKEVGEAWDALDVPGKKALMDGGGEAIRFSAAENAKVRKIGAEVCREARSRRWTARACRRARSTTRCAACPTSTRRPRRTSGTERVKGWRSRRGRGLRLASRALSLAAMMLLTVADVVLRARAQPADPRHARDRRAAARLHLLPRAAGGVPARRAHRGRRRSTASRRAAVPLLRRLAELLARRC